MKSFTAAQRTFATQRETIYFFSLTSVDEWEKTFFPEPKQMQSVSDWFFVGNQTQNTHFGRKRLTKKNRCRHVSDPRRIQW